MRAAELVDQAEARLLSSPAIDHWQRGRERLEVQDLLAHVLRLDQRELEPDAEVPEAATRKFQTLVDRRAAGKPVAYLVGTVDFDGLRLKVRPGVFIPRAYSEFLALQAVRRLRLRKHPTHVDLATGSGAVALAVAARVPAATVIGLDVSQSAVKQAVGNAKALGLDRVTFLRSDLFAALAPSHRGRVDTITFHPPFIPVAELAELPEEVLRFEPRHALSDGSHDGLHLIRRAAAEAPTWLRSGGWMLVEVSPDRSRAVAGLLRRAGFVDVRSSRGAWKVARVLTARWPSSGRYPPSRTVL